MATTKDAIQAELERGRVIDITTTGRRSGRPRRIEIVFHNIDDRVYISGMPRREKRDWLLNLEADPRFTFHLKGRVKADLPALARVIDGEGERRQVLPHVARAWRRNDVDVMVRYSPLIEVTFPKQAS
ncbi:MAG TPA: nitroreductase family deazaflavin-dependent oxidoreductase [Candidatus Dormibacteraeota bacterium]|nr:nitroreductase family deazaflavin-dependent oxidoreductase [Candidatus Dormibacteraeota bacterium]